MNAEEIISFISNAEKKTPVKVYLRLNGMVDFGPECHVFGSGECRVVFGDWNVLTTGWWKTTGAIPPCRFWISRTSTPALNQAR